MDMVARSLASGSATLKNRLTKPIAGKTGVASAVVAETSATRTGRGG